MRACGSAGCACSLARSAPRPWRHGRPWSVIGVAPQGTLARRLYPWFYGGLFLDEAFTRVAFALLPPPKPAVATAQLPAAETATVLPPPSTAAAGAAA